MDTTHNYVQGLDKALECYSDTKIIKVDFTDNIIAVTFLLDGKAEQLFIKQGQLIAACKAAIFMAKSPAESLEYLHTSHKWD